MPRAPVADTRSVARTVPSVLALALAASAALGSSAPAGAGSPAHQTARAASARLQVTQVEYRLSLSSAAVKAGNVDLVQSDRGKERHDLRLRNESSGTEIKGRLLRPGTRWEGTVYLKPGRYKLWCTLPEHAKHGMRTSLTVTR